MEFCSIHEADFAVFAPVLERLSVAWVRSVIEPVVGTPAEIVALLELVAAGAATYVGVHLGLWVSSGCPRGPERHVLSFVQRLAGRPRTSQAHSPRCRRPPALGGLGQRTLRLAHGALATAPMMPRGTLELRRSARGVFERVLECSLERP